MVKQETEQEGDEFQTRSGLPDDFDGVIRGAYFGYKAEYQGGTVPLLITPIESDEFDEPHEAGWSIGAGWDIVKGSKEARHSKHKTFTDTSMVGRLLNRCNEIGAMDFLRGNGPSPRVASTWDGLNCHWKREEMTFGKGILEAKGGKTQHLMPTQFLGGVKAPTKKAEAESGLEAQVRKLATEHDNLRKFQVAAFKVPGVADDDDLAERIQNGSLWRAVRGE